MAQTLISLAQATKGWAGGPDFDLAGTSNKRVPRPLRFLQRAGVGNVDILEHGVAAQGDK